MAYQLRQRDPLFDADTQALLERRGKELLGLALMGIGALLVVVLATYSPADPSWFSSSDAPVQNALGGVGAAIASPLYVILGWGAWTLPIASVAWGLRLMAHAVPEGWVWSAIFLPFALPLVSAYAATLVPGPSWTHSFGLGGLLGETITGVLLGILPIGSLLGLKILSLLLAAAMVTVGSYGLGITRAEMRSALRFFLIGLVVVYAAIVQTLHWILAGAVAVVVRMRESRNAYDEDSGIDEDVPEFMTFEMEDEPEQRENLARRLFRNVPGFSARQSDLEETPEPELVSRELARAETEIAAPSEDHIRARIADAIRARVAPREDVSAVRDEPPVFRHQELPPSPEPLDDELIEDDDAFDSDAGALTTTVHLDGATSGPAVRPVVQNAVRRAPAPSKKAQAEAQPRLALGDDAEPEYEYPPLSLLSNPDNLQRHVLSDEALEENARMLEAVLDDYGVKGEIVSVKPGPVVTMYELEPAPGLKASRVIGLADDIARSMSALSARVSTVPGRSVIGIELPNAHREMVLLREILATRDFGDGNQRLPLALGKDIGGGSVVANLAKMPHLLIAGTTGSGKSVAINTMILSLLYKLSPEECRLIMIDPKMLELSVYDGIPHLLSPVVTDPKKAVVALKWVVGEMEERYQKMSKIGVRNIEGYNGRVREALEKGESFCRTVQTGFDEDTGEPIFETEESEPKKLPYIVVIVDEMADLMMVAGKEIEACIQRLAQMARASGIHLIMATQRPSVDVITGTIKANFPTRISFQVTSKVDSRTILGEMGAEQLLGMGDMLYMAGGAKITRVHGPFVSDEEVEEVVRALKMNGQPDYVGGVVDGPDEDKSSDIDTVLGLGGNTNGEDALYDQAVQVVIQDRKCSTSYIQRKLAIGYNKAARLVEQMEDQGLVSPANNVGKREILIPES